jgi:energy-converting hydrogenase B subunit D
VTALQVVAVVLAGAAGTAVVLTREIRRLVLVNGVFGLSLTLLFVALQAPDVALSMLVVGSVAYPFVLLIALSIIRRPPGEDDR